MEPFVTADWLLENHESVLLVDARMYLDGRSARAAYLRGHLPGAVFVDVAEALAAPASPADGRHPLPSESELEDSESLRVVAYALPFILK